MPVVSRTVLRRKLRYKNEGGDILRNTALLTLVILAAVISFLVSDQNNRITKDLNNFNLPALKNSGRFVEIAFYYLADDDINFALCGLRSAK